VAGAIKVGFGAGPRVPRAQGASAATGQTRLAAVRVMVEKRKWDGSVGARWPAQLEALDGGRLLWVADAGTVRDRPRRGEVETLGHTEAGAAEAGAWWVATAHVDVAGAPLRYTVDASTPAELAGGTLAFVDLDLDLTLESGSEQLEDVDQFAERAARMGYPEEVRLGAWRGLRDAASRFRAGAWPFDGSLAEAAGARAPTP
jgi:hypothetical protein